MRCYNLNIMDIESFKTPGQLIKALMDERDWTQRLLAIILDMDVTAVQRIIAGLRPVTGEMALKLGELFEHPAEDFLKLQKEYELAKAQIEARPDPSRATRARLFGDLPIGEMMKRGWLQAEDIRDVPNVQAALAKFFGVDSVDQIEILPHAAKKTDTFSDVTAAQLAWIYRVKEIASEMLMPKYSPSAVRRAIDLFQHMLSAPELASKVPRILAEAGIRYVIVESLSATKIDGVAMWLTKQSPVIGMSLRFDRIDNYWFVLRHELEHILQEHGRRAVMLDAELEGERAGTGAGIAEEERAANKAATEFCIPRRVLDAFIARKSPFFHERDILGLANTLHVHPGLIAGQLQHETGQYDRFRQHLAKIRFAVTPNAMVDGWGDVVPVGL